MPTPADDCLIQGLTAGREEAFAALYDRYGRSLHRVAVTLLGNRQDAEDAVQDVFVNLVKSHRLLAHVQDLPAYLFTALRHAAHQIAARRRSDSARRHVVGANLPPAQVSDPLDADGLARALAALPADQRAVIALKIDAGLTFAQISQVLDISANTAASRYRYALEKLRRQLEKRP